MQKCEIKLKKYINELQKNEKSREKFKNKKRRDLKNKQLGFYLNNGNIS